MITALFMNLIVGATAFLLTYRLFKFKHFIDSLLSWFILYCSQIVFTQLILGIFGKLYLKNVILLNCIILIVTWYFSRKKAASGDFHAAKKRGLELLSNKVILLALALILGFGLVKVLINLVNPPFGWDNLSYHFVFPVEWLKHGNLDCPITLCDDPGPPYYPINGSLFFLWFIFPLKNLFLADLGQVPFFIVAFMAIYAICRKLSINKELSFYAAALFLITPNVFKQIEIAYVDVMMVALFLAGINFLLSLYRDFSFRNLLLWALSFGLFLGTKNSAAIYGIFPVLFFAWILFLNIKSVNLKRAASYFFVFIAITLLLGGFSYIRNFIFLKNPLYPAEIELLGRKIFKGVLPFSFYRSHWTGDDFNLRKLLFSEGLGGQLLLFAIPGLFFPMPAAIRKLGKNIPSPLIFVLSLPLLLLLSFYFLMPQFWVRYLYPILGASYVAAFYMVTLLNIPVKLIRILVVACSLASCFELSGHLELLSSMLLSGVFFLILPKILKLRANTKFVIALSALLIAALHFLNVDYDSNEFKRYVLNSPFTSDDRLAWEWLNNNTRGCRIAYTGIPEVLPLYGTNFRNDVFYVSVNTIHPAKLHYFPMGRYLWFKDYMAFHQSLESPHNYRENPGYPTWIKNLESENTDFLVVYSLRMAKGPVFPLEDTWAAGHPQVFDLAYKKDTIRIYKIRK